MDVQNTKNKTIEKTVIEYFIRAVKEHGYYAKFRTSIQNSGIMGMLIHHGEHPERDDNPFKKCRNIDDMANVLMQLTTGGRHMRGEIPPEIMEQMHERGRITPPIPNINNKYDYITIEINHLLHFFLEANGARMEDLCRIGEEIYNMTCGTLYGDEFVQDQPQENIMDISDPIQVKSKIYQDYIDGMSRGDFNLSFEQYWAIRKPDVENWIRQHSGMNPSSPEAQFLMSNQEPQTGLHREMHDDYDMDPDDNGEGEDDSEWVDHDEWNDIDGDGENGNEWVNHYELERD